MSAGACLTLVAVCSGVPLPTSGFCNRMLAGQCVTEEVYVDLHLEVRQDHEHDSRVFWTPSEGLMLPYNSGREKGKVGACKDAKPLGVTLFYSNLISG